MAWQVTIGEKSMLLDDLTQDDFMAACKGHEDVNWLTLYLSPGSNPAALYDLLCICALRMEIPSPDRPKNITESVKLLEHLSQVDDDLPKAFAEGGIPFKGQDDQETTTSSTSTEPEDGPPNKLEEQH